MFTVNYIDVLLILMVVLAALRGWRAGLIYGLIDLAGWLGSLLAALRFYQPVAAWLDEVATWATVWNRPVAFLVVMVITGLAINLLGLALASRIPKPMHGHPVNRLLGILPGLVNGLISTAILASLLLMVPLPPAVGAAARNSVLVNRFGAFTEQAEAALSPVFGDAVSQTLNMLTVRPESDERVTLPFSVVEAPPRPELEEEMLGLINEERAKVGLAPLAADPELTEVARQHSADMLTRGYFAHNTPEGTTPFDRISAAGIVYGTAGENLALAPTLSIAHTGLMNSPGHRANILRPEFGRVGIGILDAGMRGLMVTQNFRD